MIISRTPLRISFVGGGSDIPSYYKKRQGAVVSTAINKYIYIIVNKKFDNRIRASYSKTEIVDAVDELKNELIKTCLQLVGIKGGVEIASISDIPSEGTGLGSSSSYVVGLLNALYAYTEKHITADRLAEEACKIEINLLKKPIGKQDQYMGAYGGFQYIQFSKDSVKVSPIIFNNTTKRKLRKRLLLLYTRITRSAEKILAIQNENLSTRRDTVMQMDSMVKLAEQMNASLHKNNLETFGELLDQNWLLKKEMATGITSHQIDKWYKTAKQNGALGGKILGAGGGGFLLLYAPEEKHSQIIKSLPGLQPVHFTFEQYGSRIIFVGN